MPNRKTISDKSRFIGTVKRIRKEKETIRDFTKLTFSPEGKKAFAVFKIVIENSINIISEREFYEYGFLRAVRRYIHTGLMLICTIVL